MNKLTVHPKEVNPYAYSILLTTLSSNFDIEIWKDLQFEEYNPYFVSSYGQVKSSFGKILTIKVHFLNKKERACVHIIYANRRSKLFPIDELMMYAFTNYKSDIIIHKDDNPLNNRLNNLIFL
uniref:HNH nuclease domain-containing protein n=1 Tax=viral metagenome TaxID=1070528 RepID=A0A6C0LTN7_9ZZZZ